MINYFSAPGIRLEQKKWVKVKKTVVPDTSIAAFCIRAEVSIKDLQSKSRKREIYTIRQIFALKHSESYTLKAIAKVLNRDHTSIIHAIKTAKIMLKNEDALFMSVYEKVNYQGVLRYNIKYF